MISSAEALIKFVTTYQEAASHLESSATEHATLKKSIQEARLRHQLCFSRDLEVLSKSPFLSGEQTENVKNIRSTLNEAIGEVENVIKDCQELLDECEELVAEIRCPNGTTRTVLRYFVREGRLTALTGLMRRHSDRLGVLGREHAT